MTLTQDFITENSQWTSRTIVPKGLVLHSVGCAQPSAKVFQKVFNRSTTMASVHAFIDANTDLVVQTLPWTMRGSHVGGSANNTHIGCEMCESDAITYVGGSKFVIKDRTKALLHCNQAYKNAVELYTMLCYKYGIYPMTGIISHAEAYKLGVGCNHGDPEHYWTQLGTTYTMDGFRKDVKNALEKYKEEQGEVIELPRVVRVTVTNLNIRKGPGTDNQIAGTCPPGAYTIMEIQNGPGSTAGWGLLKAYCVNRNGWISLDYAKTVN